MVKRIKFATRLLRRIDAVRGILEARPAALVLGDPKHGKRRKLEWAAALFLAGAFSTLPLAYNVLMGDIPNSIAEDLHKK
jgi:hypothetical protein